MEIVVLNLLQGNWRMPFFTDVTGFLIRALALITFESVAVNQIVFLYPVTVLVER